MGTDRERKLDLRGSKVDRPNDERRAAGGPGAGPREGEGGFRRLVERSPEVVMVLEPNLTVRYVNPAVERVLGQRAEQFVGTKLLDHLPSEGSERVLDSIVGRSADLYGVPTPVKFWVLHADNSERCLEGSIVDLSEDADGGAIAFYLQDVTDREALQNDLLRRAFYDSMTGLANRALFMDRLEHALERTSRQAEPVGVLFVDLDDFKAVNDRFGHQAGDQLLVAVAERLQACLRPADTAARLGGDEFGILLENPGEVGDATRVAQRVVATVRAPLTVGDHTLFVTASVGVALSGHGRRRAQDLLRAADDAMYEAKASGQSQYVVCDEGATIATVRRRHSKSGARHR